MRKKKNKRYPDNAPYGNWKVFSPDNILMFRAAEKKANWYLKRGLAEKLSDNEIRLTFQPQGPGHNGTGYYLNTFKNICVCCGSEEKLTKHHVVPHCFRKHFPEQLKKYASHDVLLLCLDCHDKYEVEAKKLRRVLAQEIKVEVEPKFEYDKSLRRAQSFANLYLTRREICLKYQMDNNEGRAYLEDFLGKSVLDATKEEISKIFERKAFVQKNQPLALEVVGRLNNNFDDFCLRWRKHFLATLQPKFLPEQWSVNGCYCTWNRNETTGDCDSGNAVA